MKSKNVKCIGGFGVRKKTVGGLDLQQNVFVFKNGCVQIENFIAYPNKDTTNENVEKMDLVKTMFGKSVYRQTYTVRFETLKTIVYHSQEILVKEGVKLSDLV